MSDNHNAGKNMKTLGFLVAIETNRKITTTLIEDILQSELEERFPDGDIGDIDVGPLGIIDVESETER